jgi:5-methylcytosine-specific restriction protein A
VPAGRECPEHRRPSSHARGYTKAWAAYSRRFLALYRWCGDHAPDAPETGDSRCRALGLRTPATHTDHIVNQRGAPQLFWRIENHQALCQSCHSRKTNRFEGGYGN